MSEETPRDTVTWREVLARTEAQVGDRLVAKWLCEHASGADNADEFREIFHDTVSARAGAHLDHMVARVVAGEPVQYAMGRWAFRRLDLLVDKRVLIPRPDTETLVEVALKILDGKPATVVDLGTGSGAVGLALLDESPRGSLTVWMTDVSEGALDVARANAAGIGLAASGARFAHGSWFEALPSELRGKIDLIVSNPPYVAVGDPDLDPSVEKWEPHQALFGGADGLDAYREIVAGAKEWLAPGGSIALEIGHRQAWEVVVMLRGHNLAEVESTRDHAGKTRVVSSSLVGSEVQFGIRSSVSKEH